MGPDNWAVVQSKEGVMYFGNKNGVLEYDGVSWRLILLPSQGVVRSLAIDHHNKIYVRKGDPLFQINDRIYRYHADMDSIMVDPSVGDLFGLRGGISPKMEDEYGYIWMYAQLESNERQKPRVVVIPEIDGTYKIKKIEDERISHSVRKALYPDDNGIIWYGGPDGIVRQDTNIAPNADQHFQPLIRRLAVNSDSLIFGGAMGVNPQTSLPYTSNNLRFEFAAPQF